MLEVIQSQPALQAEVGPTPQAAKQGPKPCRARAPSDLVQALSASPRSLPCRFLYDELGSQLYAQITDLPEYTPYRSETLLLTAHAAALAAQVPPGALVLELGCGDSTKTALLLNALLDSRGPAGTRFCGIDVSAEALRQTRRTLAARCPRLDPSMLKLIEADYLEGVRAVRAMHPDVTLCLLWLGSSVGNFDAQASASFLAALIDAAGGTAHVILGTDLWKDTNVLRAAYDDAAGVTRRFILNGVQNTLRTLGHPDAGADDLWDYFVHVNEGHAQVEMYAVPRRPVRDLVPGLSLEAGEKLLVEISRKFTPASIASLADQAGLVLQGVWCMPGYSMQLLVPPLEALHAAWEDTDALFGLIRDWSSVPISLRNPFGFYYGHMASFARSRLLPEASPTELDYLYSRGKDPKVSEPSVCHTCPPPPPVWPTKDEVCTYVTSVRKEIVAQVASTIAVSPWRLAMVLEHEHMHQETLCYMLAQQRKRDWCCGRIGVQPMLQPHAATTAYLAAWRYRDTAVHPMNDAWVTVPGRVAQLGMQADRRRGFAWDNELGQPEEVILPELQVSAAPVTVAQFKAFIDAAKPYESSEFWTPEDWRHIRSAEWQHPQNWVLDDKGNTWVAAPEGVYALEEVAQCPAYVSLAEAEAYAKWARGRIMTETEYQQVVSFLETSGIPRAGATKLDVPIKAIDRSGWEWTSTEFQPFPGFAADPLYPEYSTDFFDGDHFVLKGASPYTHGSMRRPGFRNFYQRLYPYVLAKFRLVRGTGK